ncbi:hypothetical protein DD238_000826 [Peronospora effusa]|uniref:Uncharacterized protein n=1 Tax=Peronospora effusa TaxID=542832 RepID=A0A3M6V8I7_9STRA|nr:hypothetical protein DD238_000826 [Peronospora effusa]RQM18301.1 hypothetical protein DD237_000049 [Peronospora effusa]
MDSQRCRTKGFAERRCKQATLDDYTHPLVFIELKMARFHAPHALQERIEHRENLVLLSRSPFVGRCILNDAANVEELLHVPMSLSLGLVKPVLH